MEFATHKEWSSMISMKKMLNKDISTDQCRFAIHPLKGEKLLVELLDKNGGTD